MNDIDSYQDYAEAALEQFEALNQESRSFLVEAVSDLEINRVLDVGCGAGQMLLPFLEITDAICVGVDAAEALGPVTRNLMGAANSERVSFLRSKGENLPFAEESFDVVLCRLAIPYMNNRQTIREISRVLRPNGVFLLKTHAFAFYLGMIVSRSKTLNLKQIAYPIICLTGGLFHWLTGIQLEKGFWQGKEVFQTRGFLKREFGRVGLRIDHELIDSNPQTPSYYVVKKG
jgi:SAM-dependent methyltransferase